MKKQSVLVIDDSDIVRSVLRDLLEDMGYRVFENSSGIGSTRIAMQNSIDIALVDIDMPGISGDRLIGVFKSNPRLKPMRVIVMSARPRDELKEIARSSGADHYVSKDELHAALPILLKKCL